MLLDCYKPTFARGFTRASSHKLQVNSTPVTAVPITMACWFLSDSITVNQTLMSIAASGSAAFSNQFGLFASGANAGDPIQAYAQSGGGGTLASSTTGYSANCWSHAAAVFATTTSKSAFINGGSKGTNTTSQAPAGVDRISIGLTAQSTSGDAMSGMIAWPAIWNVALADVDIAALASGAHPATIHPESLVAFWDWTGAETEFGLKAAYPLTNTGSVPVTGPAFLRTRIPRPWVLGAGYVAAATGNRRRRTIICGAAA